MITNALLFSIALLGAPNYTIKGNTDMVSESLKIAAPLTVYISGNINESAAVAFEKDMNAAYDTGQPVIPVVIRSYGGSVYSLLSMIDVIKRSKVPVATVVVGKAMSAGAALLTCGTEGMRYADKHSTIMIHEVSSSMGGKVGDIKADADESARLNSLLMEIMSTNIGKNKNYLSEVIHSHGHADWYITPDEAIKHGIVNHIGVPEFDVEITVRTILK